MSDTTSSLALKGTVVAVASNATHEFTKPTKETIRLIEDSRRGRRCPRRPFYPASIFG